MTTTREQRRRAVAERLVLAGVWDPEGDARQLVDRFFGPDDDDAAQVLLDLAVGERERRLPLGHIVGSARIDGAEFLVGTGAFVPRSESQAVIRLAADEGFLPAGGRLVDLCAGVGTLGLAVARRRPDADVVLVERDEVPMRYLRRNAARLAASGRVQTVQEDITVLDGSALGLVDVVVSNPPYVPPGLELLPEWTEHQPHEALFGGGDGLELVRRVIRIAQATLRPGGVLIVEHDRAQPEVVRSLIGGAGFGSIHTVLDDAGEPRVTHARAEQ